MNMLKKLDLLIELKKVNEAIRKAGFECDAAYVEELEEEHWQLENEIYER